VLSGPNTQLGEQRFRALLGERIPGASVMDVGCGSGVLSRELSLMGARSVYGFDLSRRQIDAAYAHTSDLEGVTFGVHGADEPVAERFDVIAGRSILHHLDFRELLPRLFERNLLPGGRMVFMEPMGHPLTLAFHHLVRSAHTPDEWPITPADAAWLRSGFDARIIPINLLSFPAGVVSSLVLSSPENRLMRMADTLDRRLERNGWLAARGRQGIIVIDRPR
jgi:SAM-dependent methyltransferase